MTMLELKQVEYAYGSGKKVLHDVNMKFEKGTFYAILGVSGAGKSTLLSLLAGLDVPKGGQILCQEKDIKEDGYVHHRKHNISLVFQNYNLIDYMTPLENLKLVNRNANADILRDLGLHDDEINRNVLQLSGGQQQRLAIARALVTNAPIILADEPTGNLDGDTANEIVQILKKSAHELGKCVIVVTHSKSLAKNADTVLMLKNQGLSEVV